MEVERAFHAAHEQAYGHASPVEETEIVTVRARATGAIGTPDWDGFAPPVAVGRGQLPDRRVGTERYAVLERDALAADDLVAGPAIVEQEDSTIVVAPGWRLSAGAAGSALLERAP
jgi:N-methylhydantoinase A